MGNSDIKRPAMTIMIVADVLGPNRHQAISNNHTYWAVNMVSYESYRTAYILRRDHSEYGLSQWGIPLQSVCGFIFSHRNTLWAEGGSSPTRMFLKLRLSSIVSDSWFMVLSETPYMLVIVPHYVNCFSHPGAYDCGITSRINSLRPR